MKAGSSSSESERHRVAVSVLRIWRAAVGGSGSAVDWELGRRRVLVSLLDILQTFLYGLMGICPTELRHSKTVSVAALPIFVVCSYGKHRWRYIAESL